MMFKYIRILFSGSIKLNRKKSKQLLIFIDERKLIHNYRKCNKVRKRELQGIAEICALRNLLRKAEDRFFIGFI